MKNDIPEIFKDYINIIKTDNVEIMKVKKVTFSMTHEEALNDFKIFKYIIDNAYSGREYWENKGFDFNKAYESIQKFINTHESVSKDEMFEIYKQSLKGIHDGHLAIVTYNDYADFGKKYKAYFADVLLEKIDDKFKVIKSKTDKISIEDIFTYEQLKGYLFKTLSPIGHEHYLLGIRSWDEISQMTINTGNEIINIPVHLCRASNYKKENVGIFRKHKADEYNVVTSSRFWEADINNFNEKIAKEFFDCGLSLRNEKIVIWNLMGNGGGNANYPLQFINGLNDYSYCMNDLAILNSPPISIANGVPIEKIENKREWKFYKSEERKSDKGVFKGTLYVLSNDGIGSSGESAISIARSVKKCITVGQNSKGAGVFGDVLIYQLPYSDIRLIIPYKIFLGGANEGEGFDPDYWVDSTDVLGELIAWLKNPKDYQAIR